MSVLVENKEYFGRGSSMPEAETAASKAALKSLASDLLNELNPGIEWHVYQTESSHYSVFVSGIVNGKRYTGRGASEKEAKLAAAQAVLYWCIQNKNASEGVLEVNLQAAIAYFTEDNFEYEEINFDEEI